MSLRRYYHHHVKHHQRFHVAVLLTIVAVAWVAVPAVARFVDSVGSYDPKGYEPKDTERATWLEHRDGLLLDTLSWADLLKIALFIFAAIAWLAVAPAVHRPGRVPRR